MDDNIEENIDVDDFFNLDLESVFEEGSWNEFDYLTSSSAAGDHDVSNSSVPELVGASIRNTDVGGDTTHSTQPLLSAAPQPTDDVANRPQLVSSSARSLIYRSHHHDTGIKVIIDQSLSTSSNAPQPIQKLLHEETVSKRLRAHCNNHRQVIEVGSFNGSPALYFKWENGITCKEWLDKVQHIHPNVVEWPVRVRAAMAIAKTLSQFHQCNVAYNALSPKNIVLTPVEGDYVAKFIDLSDAVICSDEQTFKEMMAVDLTSLGVIFEELFHFDGVGGGVERSFASAAARGDTVAESFTDSRRVSINSDREDEHQVSRNVKKRGKQRTPGEGLPFYLGAMISTLLISGDANNASQLRYKSANDVYEDLKAMISQNLSNRRSKGLTDDHDHEGRLKFPKDLFYGRQVQMSMILHLLQSSTVLGDQPLMALIAGNPGTG